MPFSLIIPKASCGCAKTNSSWRKRKAARRHSLRIGFGSHKRWLIQWAGEFSVGTAAIYACVKFPLAFRAAAHLYWISPVYVYPSGGHKSNWHLSVSRSPLHHSRVVLVRNWYTCSTHTPFQSHAPLPFENSHTRTTATLVRVKNVCYNMWSHFAQFNAWLTKRDCFSLCVPIQIWNCCRYWSNDFSF